MSLRGPAVAALALLVVACAGSAPVQPNAPTSAAPTGPGTSDVGAPPPGQVDPPPAGQVDPPPPAGQGLLTLTLTDPDGRPIVGAVIDFQVDDVTMCCADEIQDGRYSAELAPGRHSVSFSAEGFLPATRQVAIAAGQRLALAVVLLPGEPVAEPRAVLDVDADAEHGEPVPVEDVVIGGLDGALTVTGALIGRAGGDIELCSAILESLPPQCGRPALLIRGLDLTTLPDLQQSNGVIWLDRALTLTGDVTQP